MKTNKILLFPVHWCVLILIFCVFGSFTTASAAEPSKRTVVEKIASVIDPLYPYAIKVSVSPSRPGTYEIDLPEEKLAELLQTVCPDPVAGKAFAHDGVTVMGKSGRKIGGYQIVIIGDNLAKHGDFDPSIDISDSPWRHITEQNIALKRRDDGTPILWADLDKIVDVPLSQEVELDSGSSYLLQYEIYSDVQQGEGTVWLADLQETSDLSAFRGSYVPSLPPQRQWTPVMRLLHASVPKAELRINVMAEGKLGFADVRLNKIRWRLTVNLDKAGNQDLYICYVPRSGGWITLPKPEMIAKNKDIPKLRLAAAAVAHSVDQGVLGQMIDAGPIKAWYLDPTYPLIVDRLPRVKLSEPYIISNKAQSSVTAPGIKLTMAKGERRTILMAVQADTNWFKLIEKKNSLPVEVTVQRIAQIPVYHDWTFNTLLEKRLDALVDVNDPLIPFHAEGPQVLAITFHADEKQEPGHVNGELSLEFQTAYPAWQWLKIPVELKILPVTVKPMRHFQTNFGLHNLMLTWRSTSDIWNSEFVPPVRFYGYRVEERYKNRGGDEIVPTFETFEEDPVRDIFDVEVNTLLDYCLQPMTPTLLYPPIFKVNDSGDNSAAPASYEKMRPLKGADFPLGTVWRNTSGDSSVVPTLSDWDWTQYDQAIEKFVKARGITCFTLLHTAGGGTRAIRLGTEFTYGLDHDPKYLADTKKYKQLTSDAFYQLVGDFFDAWAKHLDELGVLDYAYICVDETAPDYYLAFKRWAEAIKSRPYAKRIKIYHTLQHTEYYTMTVDGKSGSPLLLRDVFDIVAPENDDGLNSFFEPGNWNKERGADPTTWVYYVDTDRLRIDRAGLNTLLIPLQLESYGVSGFHHWTLRMWSHPEKPYPEKILPNGISRGPSYNPWINPYYFHGHGLLSFFYPPDPRGPTQEPTNKVIPSYRLALLREGIQNRAVLEILKKGEDDAGRKLNVSKKEVEKLRQELARLWINPVQWYVSRPLYNQWKKDLYRLLENAADAKQ